MMKIHNTLTRQKETFTPIHPNEVGVYICGVTVYDNCHMGHARTYVSADIMIRYLIWRGYKVKHVRNITDIDDKIIKRANENNEPWKDLTERQIKAMNEDFAALNLLKPDHEPRATEYIPQMIALIEKIIANKHAYVATNGDVCFDVRSFADYGCLSHHNIEELESGARVEISDAKRDPLDFVLWKLAKPGEPAWDSPWGKGRPGWHIECSAMATQLLGEHFDIHGGGRDLIFPHHENEIAQSRAATNNKFVNVWVHGGFLQIDKEKMSKSLGNFVTIKDVLQKHDAEDVRYLLVASHYRSPLVYTDDALVQARKSLNRFYTALYDLPEAKAIANSKFEEQFIAAMDDDFNTPIALSVLFDLAHEVQRLRDAKANDEAAKHAALLRQLGGVLGIMQSDPAARLGVANTLEAEVEQLLKEREVARASKNWAEADRIRNRLAEMKLVVKDTPEGPKVQRLE